MQTINNDNTNRVVTTFFCSFTFCLYFNICLCIHGHWCYADISYFFKKTQNYNSISKCEADNFIFRYRYYWKPNVFLFYDGVILFKAACKDFFRKVSCNMRTPSRDSLCDAVTYKSKQTKTQIHKQDDCWQISLYTLFRYYNPDKINLHNCHIWIGLLAAFLQTWQTLWTKAPG